jgi:ACS family sodium-dependent inorganic phosphate cotransporter-like MFS transporter 6/7/8
MSVGIIAMMETDPPDPSIPVSLVASLDPTHHHF